MNALLRWLVRLSLRLSPARHRERFGGELAATVNALAGEARARGRGVERGYLLQELADSLRESVRLWRSGETSGRRLATSFGEAVRDDLRGSVRRWRQRPIATAGVLVTLAAVVTAVTTTFALAHAVLWKALPLPDAERLVFVWETVQDGREPFRVTSGRFASWQRESGAFASLSLFGAAGHSMEGQEGSVPVRGIRVTASFFDTLGLRPILGRAFGPEDEVPGRHRVLVISQAMWQARFGGRPDIVGHAVRLSGEPYVIVGVMPDVVTPGWPSNPAHVALDRELREFWVPIARTPEFDANVRGHVFGAVGRLNEGVTAARADAELGAVQSAELDAHGGMTTPFREQFVGEARTPLVVLFTASLAVLLVACANLAALQVSLVERRRVELSTRLALGASRLRLVGLLGMDALLPAMAGLGLGLLWARAALAWIPGQLPGSMPFVTTPVLDLTSAIFACLVAAGATLALSAWPVARLRLVSPVPRGTSTGGRTSVYRGLVAAQVAIGVSLAVPAALLAQSLVSLRARDAGFVVDDVLVADVAVPGERASVHQRVSAFEREVSEALAALRGTRGVAFAYDHPLEANWTQVMALRGDAVSPNRGDVDVHLRIVSPSYFDTMSVNVLDGRAFEEREDTEAPGVVVVNEAFASAHGGRVLGCRLESAAAAYTWGPDVPADYEIVGVVENERFRGLEQPSVPAVYISTRQFPLTSAAVMVRGPAADHALGVRLAGRHPPRAARRHRRPNRAARRHPVGADVDPPRDGRRGERLRTGGAGAGRPRVVRVDGRQCRCRLARDGCATRLGASPAEVARAVLLASLGHASLGVAVGVVLALAFGRLVQHLLVDVSASDPRTVVLVAVVMLFAAAAAGALPARRAARIDPASALRSDT